MLSYLGREGADLHHQLGDADPRASLMHLQGRSKTLEVLSSLGGGAVLAASFPWAAWHSAWLGHTVTAP